MMAGTSLGLSVRQHLKGPAVLRVCSLSPRDATLHASYFLWARGCMEPSRWTAGRQQSTQKPVLYDLQTKLKKTKSGRLLDVDVSMESLFFRLILRLQVRKIIPKPIKFPRKMHKNVL